jgi:F420-dependent oxidoreductase-like protein
MRVSISITNYSWPEGPVGLAARVARVVHAAEAAGLDTVWVPDHLLQAAPGAPANGDMLEAYATLGFLAGQAAGIRLGAMVTAATYRSPALLIKAVTTLDVLSGGRAWLGIGAGYHEAEARGFGLSLPPLRERYERLEETLRLALQMWAADSSAFEGAHYHLERPVASPQPLSRPHPPILIGGMGERRTLPLVARYADACNLFDSPDAGATITRKLAVLAGHCEEIGRPYGEIEKTVSTRLEPHHNGVAFAERCAALAALGIEHAVVIAAEPWSEQRIAVLASGLSAG